MISFWNSMTDPQATIISAVLTIIAAVVGVLLGSWLFGGKVSDLKASVDETERLVKSHRESIEEQLSAISASIHKLTGDVGDIQSFTSQVNVQDQNDADMHRQIRDSWAAIRDKIENIAADPAIDGRTRARYDRIDRRQYSQLIDALNVDGRLGDNVVHYREAREIWQRYKNRRITPTDADIARIGELKRQLVG